MLAENQSVLTVPAKVESSVATSAAVPEMLASLRSALGGTWWIVDVVADRAAAAEGRTALQRQNADRLPSHWLALCGEVARRGKPEFIGDDGPLLGLAVPIADSADSRHVAVGLFLSIAAPASGATVDRATMDRTTVNRTAVNRAAVNCTAADGAAFDLRTLDLLEQQFGWQPANAARWLDQQIPWPAERLMAVAELVMSHRAAECNKASLTQETTRMSAHLTDLYEEISLWHRLTRHLRISENEEELGRMALEWLSATVPAESLALQLLCDTDGNGRQLCSAPVFLTRGIYPLEEQTFDRLIRSLGLAEEVQTVIINPNVAKTRLADFPGLQQLIIVPLAAGDNLIGWLAAVNHCDGEEFGSPEASLLASVGAILGIHAGNLALYRQQAEMLSGIVRALTSAIDAKDPYTCGHSDRVARISVALATEMGCDRKQLEILYLSGLLHDIGKIGIDDSVLRKPGKLSDVEYEHIKMHPEIGYRILHDLKQLGEVLPVVRHHHEAWDGRGYPFGLAGHEIPQLARIVAVADAFDAMSSDRPYRKGMEDDRLDAVLRDGAGKQWDASVVEAFFRVRDKIRQICGRDGDMDGVPEELARMH